MLVLNFFFYHISLLEVFSTFLIFILSVKMEKHYELHAISVLNINFKKISYTTIAIIVFL